MGGRTHSMGGDTGRVYALDEVPNTIDDRPGNR